MYFWLNWSTNYNWSQRLFRNKKDFHFKVGNWTIPKSKLRLKKSFSRPACCEDLAWRNLKGLAELANLTVLHHATCTKTFTQEVCGMEDLKFVWYGESKYELMYLFEKPVHFKPTRVLCVKLLLSHKTDDCKKLVILLLHYRKKQTAQHFNPYYLNRWAVNNFVLLRCAQQSTNIMIDSKTLKETLRSNLFIHTSLYYSYTLVIWFLIFAKPTTHDT